MKKNIAVALYTYDRTDDAKINLEIIRGIWEKSNLFNKLFIIHSYNGMDQWYPKTYLEDKLVRITNRGHFSGAADLIESGLNIVVDNHEDIDYIITLAADTWLLNPKYVSNIVENMDLEKKYVAASCWGNPFENDPMQMGLSTDFFIVNRKWARDYKLFPFRYDEFYKKYFEVLMYEKKVIYLERLFSLRFYESAQRYFGKNVSDHVLKDKKDELLYRIEEREPVHNYYSDLVYRKEAPMFVRLKKLFSIKSPGYRNMYWPLIELLTHHDPVVKQKHLRNHKYPNMEYTKRFVESEDLDYFNNHDL